MQLKSQFLPNSKAIHSKNQPQTKTAKSRNVPSEVWLKRHILKKLTLQLKFNKNSTHQYRKFRQIFTDTNPTPSSQPKSLTTNALKENQSRIVIPAKQITMRKLSSAKADNTTKYTDNFFASNAFSKNGLKSYHYKSSMCQGNNFINVSKAIIAEKNNDTQKIKPKSQHKRSLSQIYIKKQDNQQEKEQTKNVRPISAHRSSKSETLSKKTDFLKVTTKALHFSSIDTFLMECTRQNRQMFSRRSKTETKPTENVQISKQKIVQIKQKLFSSTRPKSCVVKSNKSQEFSNCEGWVIGNGQNQREEEEEPFFNILEF